MFDNEYDRSYHYAVLDYEMNLIYPYGYGYEDEEEEYTNKYESIKED